MYRMIMVSVRYRPLGPLPPSNQKCVVRPTNAGSLTFWATMRVSRASETAQCLLPPGRRCTPQFLGVASATIFNYSRQVEQRPLAPTRRIPSQGWCANFPEGSPAK